MFEVENNHDNNEQTSHQSALIWSEEIETKLHTKRRYPDREEIHPERFTLSALACNYDNDEPSARFTSHEQESN